MTILNAHVTPDRVLLCTDTAVVALDGSTRAEQSKILYLPHANIAMAARGVQRLTLELFAGSWMRCISNLDALEDMWTVSALEEWLQHFLAIAKQQGVNLGEGAESVELLAAGFSARRDRMIALRFIKTRGEQFSRKEIDQWTVAPNCELKAAPEMNSIGEMAALARRQIAYWKLRAPHEGFGGRLVFLDLQRGAANFTTCDI